MSADGQHLALMGTAGTKILRYKKVGNVFTKLPTITGEPTFDSLTTYAGYLKYVDNVLIAVGPASTTNKICTFIRDGDTYTLGTYTGTGMTLTYSTGSGAQGAVTINAAKTKLLLKGSPDYHIYCFTLDNGNLTREADLLTDSAKGSVYAIGFLKDDTLVVSSGTTPYYAVYQIDASYTTLTELFKNNATTGVMYSSGGGSLVETMDDVLMITDIGYGSYGCKVQCADLKARTTQITFDAAVATGAAITADYTVNGIHKTDQYVLDFQTSIQFGEGS